MNFNECLEKLDKLEVKRKADYSIWGYLYQFDLALYDMLSHNTDEDLFKDEANDSEVTYQIEVIEDYIKYYNLSDKKCLRIAQVKYSSTADRFNYWNVIVDLYYDYLYFSNKSSEEVDIKCGIFFNALDDTVFTKEQIIKVGKSEIDSFIQTYLKVAAISEADTSNKEKVKNNHNNRVIQIISEYHSEENLVKFLEECLMIRWTESREDLISLIKEKLVDNFENEFPTFVEQNKKEILYSLAINFIINEWQRKKSIEEIVEIKVNGLINHVKEIANNENIVITNMIIMNVRKAIDETIDEIVFELIEEGMEGYEIKRKLNDTYYKYADSLFAKLEPILMDKLNRFKFINTVSLKQSISKETYFKFSPIEEYGYFSRQQSYLSSYFKRLLKFISYNISEGIKEQLEIDIMLNFENDILLFQHPYEERTSILLPKTHDNAKFEHNVIFKRVRQSKVKPKVWYFDEVDVNPIYDLNICKPGQLDIDIKEPYDNRYYIECMKCLKENSSFDMSEINCIFCERCKRNGKDKNRKSTE